MRITRIGGPSVFVELDGWRILVDPTFDPPGRRYPFALGTSRVKSRGPALQPEQLGDVDIVRVSHDHHSDNLDDRGRALLPPRSRRDQRERGDPTGAAKRTRPARG